MVLNPVSFRPEYKVQISGNNTAKSEGMPVFAGLKEEVDRLDKSVSQNCLYALSPVPTARRMGSLPDTLANEDYTRAGLLAGIAAASFPGDFREMGLAFKEGQNIFKNGFKQGLSKNPYQHELSALRGTFIEKWVSKLSWIQKFDKTLFDTKFGEFLRNKFNLGINFNDLGAIKTANLKTDATGYKYTGNVFQQTAARTLHRIPVIGVALTAALELPALYNSVSRTEGSILDKSVAFGKQLIKSAGYIGLTTAGIGIAGAILYPHSAILGLIGMAIGSTVALIASKALNKQIDKLV